MWWWGCDLLYATGTTLSLVLASPVALNEQEVVSNVWNGYIMDPSTNLSTGKLQLRNVFHSKILQTSVLWTTNNHTFAAKITRLLKVTVTMWTHLVTASAEWLVDTEAADAVTLLHLSDLVCFTSCFIADVVLNSPEPTFGMTSSVPFIIQTHRLVMIILASYYPRAQSSQLG